MHNIASTHDYREPHRPAAWRGGALVVVAMLLVALPLAGLIAAALAQDASATWRGYLQHVLAGYVVNSLLISVGVALGTIALGTGAAWIIERYQFRGRNVLSWALMLPLAIPAYVSAYALTDFLAFAGPVQSALRMWFGWSKADYWFPELHNTGGAIFVFTLALYPYVYFLARDAFAERGLQLVDAARTLGLTPKQAWWRVALPVARPAVVGGAMLAVMESLADFGAVSYLNVETLTVGIFRSWFNVGNQSAAAQLALLLLGAIAVFAVIEIRARRRARFTASRVLSTPRRERVRGGAAIWLAALCALPVIVGFVLPMALLLRLLWGNGELHATGAFAMALFDSVRLGAIVALVVIALALALAIFIRHQQRNSPHAALTQAARASHRALSFAYAVPGAVLAVGLLTPFGFFDQHLPTLFFTGTIIAVVMGCAIRFYGVASNSIDAAMTRIAPNIDDAARTFGVQGWTAVKEIYLPLLKQGSLTAALLVFVDTLKELPATLALRPFNFETLSTLTYTLTKDERLAEAALPSLTIVAICLLPIWLLARGRR